MSDVVLGKEKPVEESNPEYEKLKHYIFELENHLAEAQKHAYRLVKRHRGIKGFSYMYVLCVNFPGIRQEYAWTVYRKLLLEFREYLQSNIL